jgi:hypothetical protein
LILALSLQPLLAQTTEKQPNKLDLARASGFDFGRVSELTHTEIKSATLFGAHSGRILNFSPGPLSITQHEKDLCYSLHVYQFTREGTSAPRMTGSTTCTPAERTVFRNVPGASAPPPKARYVPQ